jgi:hypothetical protein
MKYIQIKIYNNKKNIGNCNFINLKLANTNICEVTLFNPIFNIETNNFENLEILICLKKYYKISFALNNINFIETKNNSVSFNAIYTPNKDSYNDYNQAYLDVFKKWSNNEKIEWRNLVNRKKKETLLRCFAIYGGLRNKNKFKDKYIVDFDFVKEEIDIYCLLGEVFFGNKGYMGTELNSFIDCLIFYKFEKINELSKIVLEIKNYKKFLHKKSMKQNIDNIISEFRISGFQVIIDDSTEAHN